MSQCIQSPSALSRSAEKQKMDSIPADELTRRMALSTLTIVMPCLDEEDNVELSTRTSLAALDKHGIRGELIIVNDGSTDRTEEVVRRLMEQDQRIRMIYHEQPQGIGVSFWDGVQAASHDFVVMFPGDNEHDADDALTYFYLANQVDIIVPFIHNIEVRSMSRRFISSFYRFIVNLSFGMNLNYTNGTVIYNTDVLRETHLVSKGFFYQAELLIKLIRAGYLYAETPHFLSQRSAGKTKALTLKSLKDVTKTYLQLMWNVHVAQRMGATNLCLNPGSATYRRYRHLSE
jgi:glycosyltransferase involved in cell wall biosynthesis